MKLKQLGKRLRSLAGALAVSTLLIVGFSATSASAAGAQLAIPPEIGVQFYADETTRVSQCRGATGQQWAATPNWTAPILIDTDQRLGGCQLGFGVYDGDGSLAGLSISYTWKSDPSGERTAQCGNQGTYQMPVNQFRVFGPTLGIDTDQRTGWCNLTFEVSGRSDVALDLQFYPEFENNGQCQGQQPQGQFRTAFPGSPLTIGVDTDARNGGCWFSLRLRQV